jgi:hypothetical protein
MNQTIYDAIVNPRHLWSSAELDADPAVVPVASGIYGWYFDLLPCEIDVSACNRAHGATLLYVGIAPGRVGSQSNLRRRLLQHRRDRGGSTLRRSLAALLAEDLGLNPGVPGRGRLKIGDQGERALSDWIAANARVTWVTTPEPWIVEREFIERLDLPLNLMHNTRHPFWPRLTEARAVARMLAWGNSTVEWNAERNLD